MKIFTAFCLMLCCSFMTASQTRQLKGLVYLKSWAGEFPVNCARKQCRSIYELPEIKSQLIDLLGNSAYSRMIKDIEETTPIDLVDGYLIAHGWKKGESASNHYVMLVRLPTGTVTLAHAQPNNKVRWYGSEDIPRDIPTCLLENFSASK